MDERVSGRVAAPVLLLALLLIFVALALYRIVAKPSETPAPIPGDVSAAVKPTPVIEPTAAEPLVPNDEAPVKRLEKPDGVAAVPDEIRKQIETLLDSMTMPPQHLQTNKKLAAVKRARDELEALLKTLPEEYAPWINALMIEEPDFVKRRLLIVGLGEIGGDYAAMALRDHYTNRLQLADGSNEVKYTVESLGKVNNPLSYDLLVSMVGKAPPEHRFRFVTEIGNHVEGARAIPLLTDVMANDESMDARNRAAQALKKVGDAASARDIESQLEVETVAHVRQTMIGALGGIGDLGSLSVLERIATTDTDAVSRLSAIDSIGKIGGTAAKKILERIAESEQHDRVRRDARKEVVKLEQKGF
ncbi:MAG: HEAT repeat domain-containing protein [Planctomycetota bacterium]